MSDPFDQGMKVPEVLALLSARRSLGSAVMGRYYKTRHFRGLVEAGIELYGTCVLCGKSPGETTLTMHHRHYRSLFSEDALKDVVLVCQRCHRHHHRK